MANIVEIREMSNDKLVELIENGQEEMFNLRFQTAVGQLSDTSRVRTLRREMAQYKTVLHNRAQAVERAAAQSEVASVLGDQAWEAAAQYKYEDAAWAVTFSDADGKELTSTFVNLNASSGNATRRQRKAS